ERSRMALGEVVTGNFFTVLGVRAKLGRTILPSDDRPGAKRVVLLSHGTWTREYGANRAIVGQTIRIHGHPYAVVGIAEPRFTGTMPVLSAALWIPMTYVDDGEPGGMISNVPSPTGNTRLERRGSRVLFSKSTLQERLEPAPAE